VVVPHLLPPPELADHRERKVRMGSLAENTHPQIRDTIERMLQRDCGFSAAEAHRAVASSWLDTPEQLQIKTTVDVAGMFQALRREDVKVAICTSDSREGTEAFLARERLEHLVDLVVCGNDSVSRPKPDPHNALYICRELGVDPSETIMVGDTPADTLMGQQANLGLTVGVLTGVGDEHDLADADVIVADVGECMNLILPATSAGRHHVLHHVTHRGLSKITRGGGWLSRRSSSEGMDNRRAYSTISKETFSHIIVGAGSAGCVLANGLSEEREDRGQQC